MKARTEKQTATATKKAGAPKPPPAKAGVPASSATTQPELLQLDLDQRTSNRMLINGIRRLLSHYGTPTTAGLQIQTPTELPARSSVSVKPTPKPSMAEETASQILGFGTLKPVAKLHTCAVPQTPSTPSKSESKSNEVSVGLDEVAPDVQIDMNALCHRSSNTLGFNGMFCASSVYI